MSCAVAGHWQDDDGERFVAGAVLRTGPAAYELAQGIVALPICTLWSG